MRRLFLGSWCFDIKHDAPAVVMLMGNDYPRKKMWSVPLEVDAVCRHMDCITTWARPVTVVTLCVSYSAICRDVTSVSSVCMVPHYDQLVFSVYGGDANTWKYHETRSESYCYTYTSFMHRVICQLRNRWAGKLQLGSSV